MGLIDRILLQGDDSMLREELVQKRGIASSVDGGINMLGNMFNYSGPMLWMGYLFHDNSTPADTILAAVNTTIEKLQSQQIDKEMLERAKVKFRSSFYDDVDSFFGFGRADLLASFALFDDNPGKINEIEQMIDRVTPELIQKTAQEYLRTTNQTVLTVRPSRVINREDKSNEE